MTFRDDGFFHALQQDPNDDGLRLVYADFLEEHGDIASAARAELIRVQCELELLPGADPRYKTLEKRQQKLLNAWSKVWLEPLRKKYSQNAEFDRGFPVPHWTVMGASVAWMTPINPGRIPSTPPSAQEGTNPGGGGSGYKQR